MHVSLGMCSVHSFGMRFKLVLLGLCIVPSLGMDIVPAVLALERVHWHGAGGWGGGRGINHTCMLENA